MVITQNDMSHQFMLYVIHRCRFPKGMVTVEFGDGNKDLPIKQVLLHLPAWEVYRKFGIVVESKHILHDVGPASKKSFLKMMSRVYADIFFMIETYEDVQKLKEALWLALNYYDDFGTNELNEYHCSVSLVELSKLVAQKEVKEIIDVDLDESKGTTYIERTLNDATEKLIKVLSDKDNLKDNVLLEYQQSGILNRNQLPQVLIAFGLRTEINDKVIKKVVTGSSLSGMKDILELGVEQQAARKTVYYSHTAIQTSQYWGRKEQLLACSVKHLYPGFCGTQNVVEFPITAVNAINCIGKNIDDNGKLVTLLPWNIDQYIDTTVRMYSPLTCRHTDGVCEQCYGILYKNLPRGTNLGINAASQTVSGVSQMILSTKHFIKTKSQVYVIPTPANKFIERSTNGIYFKKDIFKDKSWEVGFYFKDIRGSITDLHHMTEELSVPEERYSEIVVMYIRDPDGNIIPLELTVDGQSPYLTLQFLLYMKSRYDELRTEESMFWVPMSGCKQIPVFRTTIANDSMMGFVSHVTKFLENGALTKYKDASIALQAFSSLVYDKVSVNIVQLETLLKSHLITGVGNFSIPVVSDPHSVSFGKTVDVVQNRTLSSMLALQGLKKQLSSPYIYTQVRDTGPFDPFFGI